MTKTYTMTNGETVSYKELQTVAKDFGIRANQSAAALISAIAVAAADIPSADEIPSMMEEMEMPLDPEVDRFLDGEDEMDAMFRAKMQESASEASANVNVTEELVEVDEDSAASEASGLFEFVRADNCIVIFKQKGVRITAGWSQKDFRFHCYKDGDDKAVLTSAQSMINKFKPFKNGVHGDVARIVKALTHLRKKPSIIHAMEKQAKGHQNVSDDRRKENAPTTKSSRRSTAVVCREWLSAYREQLGESYDARNVRQDYQAALADGYLPVAN
jgi:hypothetical protein